ncbi:MAG TPA: Dyp-type peroxidase, partial [Nocardioidaceae bacterium]|nr:Dyp-type peroxidase [Nocardioidaceae bacterium]
MSEPEREKRGPILTRRGLLGAAGVGALVTAGGAGYFAGASTEESATSTVVDDVVSFRGEYQAGITTPVQDRLHFAAFDLTTDDRDDLISLLKDWTAAAEAMTAGREVGTYGAVAGPAQAPPEDTGEALGLPASRLTLTIGFGRSMFVDAQGRDRFGLGDRLPAGLEPLPHFAFDEIRGDISGGDIAVQACSDDPQVAVHAIRNLARIAFGRASVRYGQLGFGRTSSTTTAQATARNLMGFKDGTRNIKADDAEDLRDWVWVRPDDGPEWMTGGSYLVTRKIMMQIEIWDREPLLGQEEIIGRAKGTGAPLSGGDEFTEPDFAARRPGGALAIPKIAHVRLAHPDQHNG